MKWLYYSNQQLQSSAWLIIRLMTGLILFMAGAGKAMGWFGGMGITTTLEMFQSMMGLGAFWTYLSTYAEWIGGFLLMIGLLTRFAAFALFINMTVATIFIGPKNFFMGGGAYPCLLAVCCLAILLAGPMRFSIDHLIQRKPVNRPLYS